MYQVVKDIWIRCAAEEVFSFHANHANRSSWHDHVTRSVQITTGPIGVGTKFDVDTISARRHVPMTIEITAYDPPHAYSYRSITTQAITDSYQTFLPENNGTRFQVQIELTVRGWLRPFGWLILKLGLEKHFETALIELKEEMEKR